MSKVLGNYLYILPFENGKSFKIGISSKSYSRIISHNKTYKIDFDKIKIFEGPSKSVRNIERILLTNFKRQESNQYKGKDGNTEIRDISDLDMCLSDISYFKDRLNLREKVVTKNDISEFLPKEIVKKEIVKKEKVKNKSFSNKSEFALSENYDKLFKVISNLYYFFKENNPDFINEGGGVYKLNAKIEFNEARVVFDTLYCSLSFDNTFVRLGVSSCSYNKVDKSFEGTFYNPFERHDEYSDIEYIDVPYFEKLIFEHFCERVKEFESGLWKKRKYVM